MKKILLVLVGAFCAAHLYAQTSDAEAEAVAGLFGDKKKEVVAKLVSVTAKDSVKFWSLYDEYLEKTTAVAISKIHLYEKTALAYSNMTPHMADSLARKYFANRKTQQKMLEEFYRKIKSATNAVTAFEFYQAEVYIVTQVRSPIMQERPVYADFKMASRRE